jgi:hypothetical protein
MTDSKERVITPCLEQRLWRPRRRGSQRHVAYSDLYLF